MKLANKHTEEGLLGGLLIAPGQLAELGLTGEDFAWDRHRQVFVAIESLPANEVDALTVAAELERRGQWAHPDADLLWLVNLRAGGTVALARYAQDLRRLTVARRLEKKLTDALAALATATDPAALATQTAASLQSATDGATTGLLTWSEANHQVTESLEARSSGKAKSLETPWSALDARTGGFVGGEFVLLAARPGQGKSTMLHSAAVHAAIHERPVVLFSAEMGIVETQMRLQAVAAHHLGQKLPLAALRHAQLSQGQVETYNWLVSHTDRLPLRLRALAGENIHSIAAACHQVRRELGDLAAIFVDYVQLLNGTKPRYPNRNEELSEVARDLKQLAIQINAPVFSASQLTRSQGNKPPSLQDLREGGNLEGHADFVAGIWCPALDERGLPIDHHRKLLVLKHRNGPSGYDVDLTFDATVPTLIEAQESL